MEPDRYPRRILLCVTGLSPQIITETALVRLLGQVTLSGEGLAPFWPYLWLGQWTHAGKGTSMGLGRHRITEQHEQ